MRKILEVITALACLLTGLGLAACAPEPAEQPAAEVPAAKIPVTSASQEAVRLYLEGRDLAEKLRAADARELFEQAVAEDDGFAVAHLGMANTSPTASDFFESLARAVAAVEGASDGEKWMIMAAQAGADGDPDAQKEHLARLVEAYPSDERAHNLLGNWHFGRQEFDQAIEHFSKAIDIEARFSPPYNSLGYAQRTVENYEAAEDAFRSYIEVLPEEPNPYDSYAELLMKTGRYQESIENYQKALSKDSSFVASYVGIGNNHIFLGQPEEARAAFAKLDEVARNDGQRRQSLFWTAVSHLHEGAADQALEALEARYQIAAATDDKATLSGDLNLMGNVLLHHGDHEAAAAKYAESVSMIEQADVSEDVKGGTRRNHLFNEARVALHRDDLDDAAAKLDEYRTAVEERQIPFEVRQVHELAGMLALHREQGDDALAELAKANQQNPLVLYLQARACQHQGDEDGMKEFATKVVDFNGLNLNLAYVKAKAEEMLAGGA
ncbi:MAG: tetratricopeptide repeat protein [bacterium]|nr:tetratricopeptide repeat protein [bacterium]